MRILLAVISCHAFRERADAQRDTWVPLVGDGALVRFFLGSGGQKERDDETLIDAGDDYPSLPYKVREVFRWALANGIDYVVKLDDDVYVQPGRLLQSGIELHDYVGPLSGGSKDFPYASGFTHGVSRRAMEILATAEIDDRAEDRWTGKILYEAGIQLRVDNRFTIINVLNEQNLPLTGIDGPLFSNEVIAVGELDPQMMQQVHAKWNTNGGSHGRQKENTNS